MQPYKMGVNRDQVVGSENEEFDGRSLIIIYFDL